MPDKENDGPDEPDYGSTHNPFNPFQKIRSIEDAADTAKLGAMVSIYLAVGPAMWLGKLLNGDQSPFPPGNISDNHIFYSMLVTNVIVFLGSIFLTWIILRKQRLWAITIVLVWIAFPIIVTVAIGGGAGIVDLVLMVIALLSFRGALAMRRFRRQEAGPPADG